MWLWSLAENDKEDLHTQKQFLYLAPMLLNACMCTVSEALGNVTLVTESTYICWGIQT